MSHVDRIARLKIELDDWQPAIWRRVEVPLTASLRAVHDVIQAAMPFEDYHLFEFRVDGQRFAIPDPEWDSLRDRTTSAKTTKLGALIDRGITELTYTYDFGDDWRHTITIEATAAADPATDYPRYLDGARSAPPEDVGGIPGFELFLEAIADPNHEEHDELMRGYGAPFDPALIDEDAIRARIAKLARRRAIGKAAFAKRRGKIN
ncbi:plasmid pRiA4b ORF-3 family protein [Methylobacterium isbiliense]|uniref:IS66 family transposase ISPre3 n=1 Tax=Methylobacterium isbiliense TaxID=315478 RepID=A0ABQ4SKG8_9HYPH|nr:plasmid pRiA4b ORF-3 family protein [Methylobacterium isbiliense]MDN3622668.1 plasmid pRiA4b ORF-3 family protein [Methylobacterium isbiliense]GJE03657.1 IS66 family transposase ISPre3 [Methylobacterium isbiliense]